MSTRRLFATPGKHAAFAGVSNLSKHSHVSPKKIKIDLEEIDAYTRKREIKRPRVYNPYFVWEPRKLIQIDLIDFSKDSAMVRKNGGHRYLFCAIDSFSRFVWVKPMKRKNQNVSLETYVAMAREFGRKPQRVLCDKGGEFTSSAFRQMFASHGTTLIALNRKAGTVERFQRSLQSLIYKFIAYTGKKRFVHRLQDLVKSYNTRHHRIIKMSPTEAEQRENLETVRENLREYYEKALSKRQRPRFKIGDKVRAKSRRNAHTRGYQDTFTESVYQVVGVNTVLPRPMFTISPLDDEANPIDQTFYAEELQRVGGKAFREPKVLLSERSRDGQVKHRVRVTVGKKQRIVGWFSDEELNRIRGR